MASLFLTRNSQLINQIATFTSERFGEAFSRFLLHESDDFGAAQNGCVVGQLRGIVHQHYYQATSSVDIIEVKCRHTAKNMTITEACSSIKHFYLGQSPNRRCSSSKSTTIGTIVMENYT